MSLIRSSRAFSRIARWTLKKELTFSGNWIKRPVEIPNDCVVLYAHFEPYKRVSSYVFSALESYRRAGFDVIFGSTSELFTTDISQLNAHCAGVLIRPNFGYDFSTWRDMLRNLNFLRGKSVLLTNSSIVGPLTPMDSIFKGLRAEDRRIVGLLESQEFHRHLQSYFLFFPRRITKGVLWRLFWKLLRDLDSKDLIITNYEVNVSDFFSAAYDSVAIFKVKTRRNPLEEVFSEIPEFPFVKRAVIESGTIENSRWPTPPPRILNNSLVQDLLKSADQNRKDNSASDDMDSSEGFRRIS